MTTNTLWNFSDGPEGYPQGSGNRVSADGRPTFTKQERERAREMWSVMKAGDHILYPKNGKLRKVVVMIPGLDCPCERVFSEGRTSGLFDIRDFEMDDVQLLCVSAKDRYSTYRDPSHYIGRLFTEQDRVTPKAIHSWF